MYKNLVHILNDNKLLVLLDQGVFSGSSFLYTILMAQILEVSQFGIYASIVLFVYLIICLTNAIIIQPFQVTLSNIKNIKSYISFCFWLQVFILLLILFGIILLSQIESLFPIIEDDLLYGIIIFMLGFVMNDFLRKLFIAKLELRKALYIDIITSGINVLFLCSILFNSHLSLTTIMIFLGIGYLPGILLGIIYINPIYITVVWNGYLRIHYHQSKWLLFTAFIQWWSSNLFVVASGVFLGIRALGAFRLVQSLFGVLNILFQTFENYVLPQTSRMLSISNDAAKKYLKQVGTKSAIIFSTVLLLIFTFSKFIIVLAGGVQYEEYHYLIKGMSILYLIIFIGYPIRIAIRSLMLNKHFFGAYFFSFLFNLISFKHLLTHWNLYGAIAGLIISQIIILVYWQFILIKKNFLLWK